MSDNKPISSKPNLEIPPPKLDIIVKDNRNKSSKR